jgi:hypothetical protein
MSALEALIASGGEAPLLESLSFDLPQASTAIVDRKQGVRAYPTSASSLVPTGGSKSCRIRLGGNEFVDPASLRLQFQVTNNDANLPLQPAVGPWGCWGLVRLLSNGVELDNSQGYYHRFHQMFGWNMLTMEQQYAESAFGWAGAWSGNAHANQGQIAKGGATVTVSHKLILSLTTAGRFLPLRYAPLELEVTLSNPSDWLVQQLDGSGNQKYSTNFTVSNLQLYYDSVSLDEAVSEAMYKALLSNRVLNIGCQQYFSLVQSIPTGSTQFSFSIVRAFSRLTHIWISFRSATGLVAQEFIMPTAQDAGVAGGTPTWSAPVFNAGQDDKAPQIRVSIGPKNYPDYQPVASLQEHYWMLQKALPAVPYLDRKDFSTNGFVSVFDLRRTPGDATSAISTRQGDQIRINITGLTPSSASSVVANAPIECHVVLWAMAVTSIRESGVTLCD